MKIFISYRRDDTGGRAGRLYDVLAARYGSQDVFLDVTAVAPGTPFDERVDTAIRASDVVLVVIGPHWLDGRGAHTRRIDHDDDYVRHEVRAALAGDVRVVPVLVDGATLPGGAELPDDLRPLVRRQAVTVRDDSWHRDVDELVRWLEGRPSGTPDGDARRRRRLALIAAVASAVVIIGGTITAIALQDDDRDGDASEDEPTVCAESTAGAADVDVDGQAVEVVLEGYDLRVEPRAGRHRLVDGEYEVEVDVAISNTGTPKAGTFDDDIYVSYAYVGGLIVDGVKTDRITCTRYVGMQQLPPGQVVLATFGFASEIDPAGARISLEMNPEGEVPIGTG